MLKLQEMLNMERCPHCKVDNPNLRSIHSTTTTDYQGRGHRTWKIYVCNRCGGLVIAAAYQGSIQVIETYPSEEKNFPSLSDRAREYLTQARNSLHAPSGAVMLSASAVDAMLKDKNYTDGSLYTRINQAATDHLITQEMAKWAHEVRLDANEQRHSDTEAVLPTNEDAQRVLDFTYAFAEFLFELPSKVSKGLEEISSVSQS